MDFDAAEALIKAHIEEQWRAGDYAADTPLQFENEDLPEDPGHYISITIEGVYGDKTIYGSTGKRLSIEAGIVFIHGFGPRGVGKRPISRRVVALTKLLELRVIAGPGDPPRGRIQLAGGAPPSPVSDDAPLPKDQPAGRYYRCSGSVPFIVLGAR